MKIYETKKNLITYFIKSKILLYMEVWCCISFTCNYVIDRMVKRVKRRNMFVQKNKTHIPSLR